MYEQTVKASVRVQETDRRNERRLMEIQGEKASSQHKAAGYGAQEFANRIFLVDV